MRIDWTDGKWTVWDMKTGCQLGQFETIAIRVHSELVNTDGGRHGYLIVGGTLKPNGKHAVIE